MNASEQKKVLVVDDSTLMRRLISEIVEADPDLRVVDVAENGRVALQKVREHRPDCVLLDLEMPELSGLDTLRRLRLRSSAKVVILSHLGHEGARVRAEGLRLGAVDVIDKPTGAVSLDLRNTRGSIIRDTLRRALGLPPAALPVEPMSSQGASATASILAVDVQRLASLCERVEATALVAILNEHLALVADASRKHDGVIDASLGGATLVAFGVPQRRADHASRAVAAGSELLEAFSARRAERADAGNPGVEVGMAIVSGVVLAGKLGPPSARRYRTVGGAVDGAARLGRWTEAYGVGLIMCGRTLAGLATPVPTRRIDIVELEPDGEPVTLYEVLAARSELNSNAHEAYARGLGHYEFGRFAGAIKAFDEALKLNPSDVATTRLRARCQTLLRAPPASWRGVWPLDGAGR